MVEKRWQKCHWGFEPNNGADGSFQTEITVRVDDFGLDSTESELLRDPEMLLFGRIEK